MFTPEMILDSAQEDVSTLQTVVSVLSITVHDRRVTVRRRESDGKSYLYAERLKTFTIPATQQPFTTWATHQFVDAPTEEQIAASLTWLCGGAS
jgi:hypothetical protein